MPDVPKQGFNPNSRPVSSVGYISLDIVLFDCSDYRQIPYYFGVNHAALVIKRGSIVVNRTEH